MMQNADSMLASLAHLNEREGVLFKMTRDPRITPVGAFLRRYSLDELPQLWNVIKGDMSLVGPRPSIKTEVAQYKHEHLRRLDVVPGITGLWQVEARNDPSFDKYIALDSKYVSDWSIWLDIRILLRTVRAVFMGTGS
jgi:lipopolysaccharide/colanic/teichoic acid biosynthesis glycosyltransferase